MNKSHYKKKIGSREEVYMGIALKTNGGLFKKDIIQKNTNGKYSYVSKKLSEIAKERNVFSNYRKRQTRVNKVPINVNTNASLQPNKLTMFEVNFILLFLLLSIILINKRSRMSILTKKLPNFSKPQININLLFKSLSTFKKFNPNLGGCNFKSF